MLDIRKLAIIIALTIGRSRSLLVHASTKTLKIEMVALLIGDGAPWGIATSGNITKLVIRDVVSGCTVKHLKVLANPKVLEHAYSLPQLRS